MANSPAHATTATLSLRDLAFQNVHWANARAVPEQLAVRLAGLDNRTGDLIREQ
jgi:hypothetical protein